MEHVPRAAVFGLHPDSCRAAGEMCSDLLLRAAFLRSDASGNQALRGILNGLSLQAAGEASDSSSCMERLGPSPVSLYSECQVGLAEGKSLVFSGWAVPEQ